MNGEHCALFWGTDMSFICCALNHQKMQNKLIKLKETKINALFVVNKTSKFWLKTNALFF